MARHLSALKTSAALLILLLGLAPLGLAGCRLGEGEGVAASGEGREGPTGAMQPEPARAAPRRLPIPTGADPVPIATGELHHRDFDLEAGDFLHLVVQQQGIDLAVQLRDPEGELLIRVDSPNGKNGPEELVEIAATPGRYRFEVVAPAKKAAPGRYSLQVVARRPATPEDRELVAADHAHHAGRELVKAKKYREAVERLQQALPVWVRLGLVRRQAYTSWRLCHAYASLGETELVRVYCAATGELGRRLGEDALTAEALRLTGWSDLRLGAPERALAPLQEARRLFERMENDRGIIHATAHLGAAYRALGQLQPALSRFEEALNTSREAAQIDAEALVLSDMGGVLLDLNRPQEAFEGYTRALEIYRQLKWPEQTGIALTGMAHAALQLDDLERAEVAAREALALQEEQGDRRNRALAFQTLGMILRREEDFEGARAALQDALKLASEADDLRTQGFILLELGYLAIQQGDPRGGLTLEDRALTTFMQVGDATGEASARIRGAEALRDLGRLGQAWQRIEPALATIENLRQSTVRSDLRTHYFAFRQEYYEIAIDLLMRRYELEPEVGYQRQAFLLNERRLARGLIDSLAEEVASERAPSELLHKAEELEERVRQAAMGFDLQSEVKEARLRQLMAELYRVRGEIRQVRPTGSILPTVSVKKTQEELLDSDSLLLVYALGERQSYLWAISKDAETVHFLPPREELEALTKPFPGRVMDQRKGSAEARRWLARRLGEVLLGPVVEQLGHRRLVVVIEGALQSVPFAALTEPGISAEEGDRFLVLQHEIVILPSVTTLATLRRAEAVRPSHSGRVAAFADPVFTRTDPRLEGGTGVPGRDLEDLERSARRLGFDVFGRLPHSRAEAEAILALIPGRKNRLITGFEANREAVSSSDLRDFDTLHFATHAFVDTDHPDLSGLVLSLVDEQGRPRDGFLRAFEISRMNLPVNLVVLSACQTGVGKDLRGEGMLSLTRSFFSAGASRVVASLWRVSDRRTKTLMEHFYGAYLKEGLAPAAALRHAQLTALGDPQAASPYSWAGFVFYGDWRSANETFN